MSDKTETEDLERVKAAVQTLGDFFDAIQIFASRHESGTRQGTVSINYGEGNWYTRYGQTKEWIVREEERSRKNESDP